MKKNNKGFSLVELIVVIAVMAVLVVVLAPSYLRYVDKARLQKDINQIGEVIQSVKIAASEEKVSAEIPTVAEGSSDYWQTFVKIESTSGGVSVLKSVGGLNGTSSASTELQEEVIATVGSVIDFENSIIKNTGIEIYIERDENYNVDVKVNTYMYEKVEDAETVHQKLVEAFGVYRPTTQVATDKLATYYLQIETAFNDMNGKYNLNTIKNFLGTAVDVGQKAVKDPEVTAGVEDAAGAIIDYSVSLLPAEVQGIVDMARKFLGI